MKAVICGALLLLAGCMSARSTVSTMSDGTLSIAGDSRGITSSLAKAHSKAMEGAATYCSGKAVKTLKFDDAPQFNSFSTVMAFTCQSK